MTRLAIVPFALLALASPSFAQTLALVESPAVGDTAKYSIELKLAGNLIVQQDGARHPIKLEAIAAHDFADRTLAVADGMPVKSARYYSRAAAAAVLSGDKIERTLAADRRVVVARRNADGPFCYSPAGPLTRDELDLVTEHFSPQCLAGLLPGKEVAAGDTWQVSSAAVQSACLFDGLIKNALVGKLTDPKAGTFTIEGTAEGIEQGAKVSLVISATGTFDPAAKRVVALTWKQKDVRELGPVNPASEVEATITLKREPLPQVPPELTAAPDTDPTPLMTHLRHADAQGRFRFVYPREWHITGQTEKHLVMRLLDRGEFVAQATITGWKKAEPGKHTPADEFKKAVAESPGWITTRVLEDAALPTDGGRWIHRIVAEGKMENLPVIQAFHLVAGPQGDQVVVTVATKPEQLKAVGTRDVGLVNAIEVGKK